MQGTDHNLAAAPLGDSAALPQVACVRSGVAGYCNRSVVPPTSLCLQKSVSPLKFCPKMRKHLCKLRSQSVVALQQSADARGFGKCRVDRRRTSSLEFACETLLMRRYPKTNLRDRYMPRLRDPLRKRWEAVSADAVVGRHRTLVPCPPREICRSLWRAMLIGCAQSPNGWPRLTSHRWSARHVLLNSRSNRQWVTVHRQTQGESREVSAHLLLMPGLFSCGHVLHACLGPAACTAQHSIRGSAVGAYCASPND